ncbi:hypothetical protein SNK03_010864 [Fusarium graminearum]
MSSGNKETTSLPLSEPSEEEQQRAVELRRERREILRNVRIRRDNQNSAISRRTRTASAPDRGTLVSRDSSRPNASTLNGTNSLEKSGKGSSSGVSKNSDKGRTYGYGVEQSRCIRADGILTLCLPNTSDRASDNHGVELIRRDAPAFLQANNTLKDAMFALRLP